MKRTTITLPDQLADHLVREARRRETSVSAIVRQLILDGLGGTSEKPREIPWAAMVEDPGMVHGVEIEKALEEDWADDIEERSWITNSAAEATSAHRGQRSECGL